MSTKTPTPIHQAVQEYYGKTAREAGTCCEASPSPKDVNNELYPVELLGGIPADIASFSAGSGDPITLANLQPGETVLDLGSGGGLDCFLAAKQVGKNGRVIGVDMTSEMLERARSNAARLKLPNVEFREGFLEALPVEDQSIDVIISNCVINLSPDKPQVFREMLRTLKPSGRIAVSDMATNHPQLEDAGTNKEGWCSCSSGALPVKEYTEELRRAGFVDIRIEPNMDVVIKAIDSGRVRSQQNRSKELLLQDLQHWEDIPSVMVVPQKITARKPA